MKRMYSLFIVWVLLYPFLINASAQAKEFEMVRYPTIPAQVIKQAEQLKQVFNNHEVFKNKQAQKHILEYLGDKSYVHVATLSQDAYILPGTYEGKAGWKGSFLPIVYMCFCNHDTQLSAFMAKKRDDPFDHHLLWDLSSGQLLGDPCEAYFDLELEGSRPPETVQAESDDKQLKALVTHEFYPNDYEYPAPGKGAYKPQYQATVDILWNCTYKQLLAYVFLRMGI